MPDPSEKTGGDEDRVWLYLRGRALAVHYRHIRYEGACRRGQCVYFGKALGETMETIKVGPEVEPSSVVQSSGADEAGSGPFPRDRERSDGNRQLSFGEGREGSESVDDEELYRQLFGT